MCVANHKSHNSHAGCDPLWCKTLEHRGLERLVFWAERAPKPNGLVLTENGPSPRRLGFRTRHLSVRWVNFTEEDDRRHRFRRSCLGAKITEKTMGSTGTHKSKQKVDTLNVYVRNPRKINRNFEEKLMRFKMNLGQKLVRRGENKIYKSSRRGPKISIGLQAHLRGKKTQWMASGMFRVSNQKPIAPVYGLAARLYRLQAWASGSSCSSRSWVQRTLVFSISVFFFNSIQCV